MRVAPSMTLNFRGTPVVMLLRVDKSLFWSTSFVLFSTSSHLVADRDFKVDADKIVRTEPGDVVPLANREEASVHF